MIHCLSKPSAAVQHTVLRKMFEARKRIFIDLLRWDLPVLADRYEVDSFDNEDATYLVLADEHGSHRASARLLPTTGPHILDTLFPQLCDDSIPRGPTTLEITRFCLERRSRATERRQARDELIHGLVTFALENGIERFTGVAEKPWLSQILSFGWHCQPLGRTKLVGGRMLGAMLIEIDENTPTLLDRGGVTAPARPGESRHVH